MDGAVARAELLHFFGPGGTWIGRGLHERFAIGDLLGSLNTNRISHLSQHMWCRLGTRTSRMNSVTGTGSHARPPAPSSHARPIRSSPNDIAQVRYKVTTRKGRAAFLALRGSPGHWFMQITF